MLSVAPMSADVLGARATSRQTWAGKMSLLIFVAMEGAEGHA